MTRVWSKRLQGGGLRAARHSFAAAMLCGLMAAGAAAQAEDWGAVEKASKGQERVLVYSTLRPDNWKPIQDALKERYSWIRLEPLRMGSHNEALERYRAESASGTRSADIVIASLPEEWPRMSERKEVIDFDPTDLKKLPKFAKPGPGYFTLSVEPQVMVYNKLLLPAAMQPKGFTDLADKIAKNPALFKNKVSSYNPTISPFSYGIYWTVKDHHGDKFWPMFDKFASSVRFEQTTGVIIDKVMTGEYFVGLFLPEPLVPTIDATRGRVLGVLYPNDGTPVSPRTMGIPKTSQSPDSAKLVVNFLLSEAGQQAMAKGGMMPYYPGVAMPDGRSYEKVVKEGGAAVIVEFKPEMETGRDAFMGRMRKALGQ